MPPSAWQSHALPRPMTPRGPRGALLRRSGYSIVERSSLKPRGFPRAQASPGRRHAPRWGFRAMVGASIPVGRCGHNKTRKRTRWMGLCWRRFECARLSRLGIGHRQSGSSFADWVLTFMGGSRSSTVTEVLPVMLTHETPKAPGAPVFDWTKIGAKNGGSRRPPPRHMRIGFPSWPFYRPISGSCPWLPRCGGSLRWLATHSGCPGAPTLPRTCFAKGPARRCRQ